MDGFDVKQSIAGATTRTLASTSTQVAGAVNVSNRSQTNMTIAETGSVRYKAVALDAVTQVELIYGKADANLSVQVGAIRTRPLAIADTAESFVLDQGQLNAADGQRGIFPRDFVVSSMLYNVPHGATVGNVAFGTLSTSGAALVDSFAIESRPFVRQGDGRTALRVRDLSGIEALDDTYSLVAANASGELRFKQITNAFKSNVELQVPITNAGITAGYTDAYVMHGTVRVLEFDSLMADEHTFVLDAAKLQAVRAAAGNSVVTFHATNGLRSSSFAFRILDGPFYRVHGEGAINDIVPKVFIGLDQGYAHHVTAPFDRSIDYPGYAIRLLNNDDGDGRQGTMITSMQFTGINETGSNTAPVAILVGDNYADPTFEMDDTLQAPTSDRVVSTGRMRIQLADATGYLTTAADVRPTYTRFVESLYAGGAYTVSGAIASHIAGAALVQFDAGSAMQRALAVGHRLTIGASEYTVMRVDGTDVTLDRVVATDLTDAVAQLRLGSGDFVVNSGSLRGDAFNAAPTDRFLTLDGNLRVGAVRGTFINSRTLSVGGSAPGDTGLFVQNGNAFINVTGTTDIASTTFRVGPTDDDSVPHFWLMANGARSSLRAPGDIDISTSANATVEATNSLHLYGDQAIYATSEGPLVVAAARADARFETAALLSVGGLLTTRAVSANTVVTGAARTSVGGAYALSVGGDASRVVVGADTTTVGGAVAITSAANVRVTSATGMALSAGGNVQLSSGGSVVIAAAADIAQVAAANMALSVGGAFGVLARNAVALTSTTSNVDVRAAQAMSLVAGGPMGIAAPRLAATVVGNVALSVGNALAIDVGAGGLDLAVDGVLDATFGGRATLQASNGFVVSVGGAASLTVTDGPLVLSTEGSIFAHTDANLAVGVDGRIDLSASGTVALHAASLTAGLVGAVDLRAGGAFVLSVAGDALVRTDANALVRTGGDLTLSTGGALDAFVVDDARVRVASGNLVLSTARGLSVAAATATTTVGSNYRLSVGGALRTDAMTETTNVSGNSTLDAGAVFASVHGVYTISTGQAYELYSNSRLELQSMHAMQLSTANTIELNAGNSVVVHALNDARISVNDVIDMHAGADMHLHALNELSLEASAMTVSSGGGFDMNVQDATIRTRIVDLTVESGMTTVVQDGGFDLSAGGNVHVKSSSTIVLRATDLDMHAGEDGRLRFGSDLALSVGANTAVSVGGLATVAVGQSLSVGAGAAMTISTGASLDVFGAVAVDIEAVGAASLAAGAMLALSGVTGTTLSTGGSFVATVASDASLTAGANALVRATAGNVDLRAGARLGLYGATVDLAATGEMDLSVGGNLALVTENGDMTLSAGADLAIAAADAYALSATGITEHARLGGWHVTSLAGASLSAAGDIAIDTPFNLALDARGNVTIDAGINTVVVVGEAASLSVGGELDVRVAANVQLATAAHLAVLAASARATVTNDLGVSVGGAVAVSVVGAVQLATAQLGVAVGGATDISVGTTASIAVGGAANVQVGGAATLAAAGPLVLRTADTFALSVAGNAQLVGARDVTMRAGAALALAVGTDASLSVARDLAVSVGGELDFALDGNAVVSVAGDLDASVGGAAALAVADALAVSVGSDFALRSANLMLVGTDLARSNAISVAGAMAVRVSGALLATSVAGGAETVVGTNYSVRAQQGSLSLGAATTATLSAGGNVALGAGGAMAVSVVGALSVTSGALVGVDAARLAIALSGNAVVRASDASVVLTGGDFVLSTSAGVRMTAIDAINMVAPDGLIVDALDGLSMGSAVGGAGNIVLSRTDGLRAATTAANIHLYSTAVDGPSMRLDAQGGAVRVANQHTFEVTGASGRFDVSVNSAYFTNDLIVRGDLRVLGDQVIEGGTVQLQTRDLNIEDKCIELAVIVQDEANTVVAVEPIAAFGDFSLSADLTTLSTDLSAPIKFPLAGSAAWPWFRPYDAATAPAGAGAYLASLVRADFDVNAAYANRELFIRTDGQQDLANGVIYDSFVTHARFERAFAVPQGNIVLLKTSGSVLQPNGANVEVYSNAFLYGLNGDAQAPAWADEAATGTFAAKAPAMAVKYYSDTMADQGGIKLRANKLESVMWYKATGSQTRPYWRVTSDLFISDKNAFHFATPGTEGSAHWFMFVDPTTGSLVYAFGTAQSYLIASALDRPMAI